MSGIKLSSKISTNNFNDFIIKNKCDCDNDTYLKITPKEFDDLYMELYKQLLYNISLIKLLSNKKTIMLLIKDTDSIIMSFSQNNIYCQYGDDKIFYACIPFYNDFNQVSCIKISSGINFMPLICINEKTDISKIYKISNDISEEFSKYLII